MPENLKRIYVPNDNLEADLIKETLEQNGIYCFIQGYEHRSMLGILGSYVELGIMVPEDQAQEASKIVEDLLKSMQVLPPEFEDEEEKEAYIPPRKFRPKSKRVAFILGFVVPGTGSCYAGNSDIGSWIVAVYIVCLVALGFSVSSNISPVFPGVMIVIVLSLVPLDIIMAFKTLNSKKQEE